MNVDLFTPNPKTLQTIRQAVTPDQQTTLQNRADLADTLGAPVDLAAAFGNLLGDAGNLSAEAWRRLRR